MKLDHIALYVLDLEQAKDFFIRYFMQLRMICIIIPALD